MWCGSLGSLKSDGFGQLTGDSGKSHNSSPTAVGWQVAFLLWESQSLLYSGLHLIA